jgi:5-methyltetrahydrofolate--homocysteine methyltransferase
VSVAEVPETQVDTKEETKPLRLSGSQPFTQQPGVYIMIGERTNVAGSPRFAKLVKEGKFEEAVSVARQQVENGANILDICMDEGMIDGVAAMSRYLQLLASEPEVAKLPFMVDSSKWTVIEAGLKCLQGKGIVNSISLKEGEEKFRQNAATVLKYGAAAVVMAFDEQGQKTSSSIPTFSPLRQAWRSTTTTRLTLSTPLVGSRPTCRTPR